MKSSVFILFMVFFSTALFAQAPDTLWTKIFGGGSDDDVGYSIQQTSDGGYIVAGYTSSFENGFDVWLIKTDSNGDTMWTKTFGGGSDDISYSVQQTSDGGYVLTGLTYSFGMGRGDVWLVKTDANGDTMWTKTFGDSLNDYGNSIQQTSDGGYIIVGNYGRYHVWGLFDSHDVWLIKTDADGDTMWTKTFGDSLGDEGNSVQQTSDDGFIVCGTIITSKIAGRYNFDFWLIKTDDKGDTLWTKTYGGDDTEKVSSVQQTSDKGYIITGYTRSFGAGSRDIWLIKIDDNGDTQWTKTYGGGSSDVGYSVQQTSDGGYVIVGATDSFGTGGGIEDVWLIKTDNYGDTLWTKTFGGSSYDYGYSAQQTTDGGYIIAGSMHWDVLLIKVAPDVTSIDVNPSTSINGYQLRQNYPNPFNPTTTINYQLPVGGEVELTIFNLLGQQIRTMVNTHQPAGANQVQWDGMDESGKPVTSGIYFYQLKSGSFSETKKMVLVR